MTDLADFLSGSKRLLLINSHGIDTRLPWARWHQPTGLLQIGTSLRQQGYDVRFIDCLGWNSKQRTQRRKVGSINVEGYRLDLWRFGGLWGHLDEQIYSYKREGWIPDQVFVSCFQTTWWKAAQELIQRIKSKWFPGVEVVLGGVYPTVEPEHAARHSLSDRIFEGSVQEVRNVIPDLHLYEPGKRPSFAGVYLYYSQSVADVESERKVEPREPERIVAEIAEKHQLGVTEFAFFDEEIREDQKHHFLDVLKALAKTEEIGGVRFVALGNISPQLIDGTVAKWMGKAGFKQVYLQCDISYRPGFVKYETSYDTYRHCVDALVREAKFSPRGGDVTAMVLVGKPYEDIEAVTERLIQLASIVGSINLVQYQYNRGLKTSEMYSELINNDDALDLTALNSKLYPLGRLSGISYECYADLTRLAALLNSKYRGKTFDFLGNGLVAQAVQESFLTEGWNPLTTRKTGKGHIPLSMATGDKH